MSTHVSGAVGHEPQRTSSSRRTGEFEDEFRALGPTETNKFLKDYQERVASLPWGAWFLNLIGLQPIENSNRLLAAWAVSEEFARNTGA